MDLRTEKEKLEPTSVEDDYSAVINSQNINAEVQMRVKHNQIAMLKTRGYTVFEKDAKKEKGYGGGLTQFIKRLKEVIRMGKTIKDDMSVLYTKPKDDGFGRLVFVKFLEFPENKKTGKIKKEPKGVVENVVKDLDALKYSKDFKDLDVKHVILISLAGLSSHAKKEIDKLKQYKFEVFTVTEMTYIPINHFFAPEYRILSEKDWAVIKKRNKIKEENIPKMLKMSRIPRYYGVDVGTVLELKYKTLIPGVAFTSKYSHIEYRVVRLDD